MNEEQDMADHLIAATKMADQDGLTKEQYMHAASVFWDSWHEVRDYMADNDVRARRSTSEEADG